LKQEYNQIPALSGALKNYGQAETHRTRSFDSSEDIQARGYKAGGGLRIQIIRVEITGHRSMSPVQDVGEPALTITKGENGKKEPHFSSMPTLCPSVL